MRLKVQDIEIDYDVEGARTGKPIVFIHGFPFDRSMWKPQIEFLRKEYYVISYDLRGHGASTIGDGQYSVEYFVDDLIALLDHLKISKAVVVGLSMGGYIALRALERNPERFRGIVLADTRSEADGNDGRVKRAMQAIAVKATGMRPFSELFVKGLFYEKTFQTNPGIIESIKLVIERSSPVAVAGTLLALAARTDTTTSLFTVKVPALILVGQHDVITPPSASHAMKDKIPGAELHVIPKAGHLSNLEQPEEFNQHLMKFLKNLPAG